MVYTENLKVYARSPQEMKQCKESIAGFSKDISMDFGLSKCVVIHTKKVKVVDSNIVEDIPLLSKNGEVVRYKYLGVLQSDSPHHKTVQ